MFIRCRALCPCAKLAITRPLVSKAAKEYEEKLEQLASLDKYKSNDDFTVVYQPFMKNLGLPEKVSRGDGWWKGPCH